VYLAWSVGWKISNVMSVSCPGQISLSRFLYSCRFLFPFDMCLLCANSIRSLAPWLSRNKENLQSPVSLDLSRISKQENVEPPGTMLEMPKGKLCQRES